MAAAAVVGIAAAVVAAAPDAAAVAVAAEEGDRAMKIFIPLMKSKSLLAVTLLLSMSACSQMHKSSSTAALPAQRFSSPELAFEALKTAALAENKDSLKTIFGSDTAGLIDSGDSVEDRLIMKRFGDRIQEKHSIEAQPDGRYVLSIGNKDWPFPIPIVQDGKQWKFDTAAGREEILDRRIGENELKTIRFMHIYADAQQDYFQKVRKGNRIRQYAQKALSSPGKNDGLYWKPENKKDQSPLGPVIAEAVAEGYTGKKEGPIAYHGYYFRTLTSQGSDAAGGKKSYLDKKGENMVGGFALLAYPAGYGSSGVMSFIVNQDGVVYQKDLGIQTLTEALDMKSFNPDPSWDAVNEDGASDDDN